MCWDHSGQPPPPPPAGVPDYRAWMGGLACLMDVRERHLSAKLGSLSLQIL